MWWSVVCILINAEEERKPPPRSNAQYRTRMTNHDANSTLLTTLQKARNGRQMPTRRGGLNQAAAASIAALKVALGRMIGATLDGTDR